MHAIQVDRFGDADELKYRNVADYQPQAGQVTVRLRAAGINPADTYIRSGTYAFFRPPLPYTPGFDGAGEVDQVGPGVTDLEVGDRVFVSALGTQDFSGTYAEQMVVSASAVHHLPAQLSFSQGAAIGVPCATAWRALHQKAFIQAGETVLIHGASGAVGVHATQLAVARGAKVIGTASTAGGRELVLQAGAASVVDHTAAEHFDSALELTDGRGFDVIIEMLADVNLERDVPVLAKNGRIVIVGSRGTIDFSPRSTMAKEATIMGTALWNATPSEIADAQAGVVRAIDTGALQIRVGAEWPLQSAPEAHRRILQHGARGKIVLVPSVD